MRRQRGELSRKGCQVSTDDGLRAALYHRFAFLWPLIFNPLTRRLWRLLILGLGALYFLFILSVLGMRYVVLPHIEDYRPSIERAIGEGIGQKVSIGRIEASWQGINPDLTLRDVRIDDGEGRPALTLAHVETTLSWWSLPAMQLRLRVLRIEQPVLNLRRDADGQLFVAGLPVRGEGGGDSSWILAQRRIRIVGATLIWDDEQRQAPPLVMQDVNIAIDNDGRRHRFALTARAPEALASRIDVRGDFRGRTFEHLADWQGQAFAELGYIDLEAWRPWVDYPLDLSRGHGAFRAWLSLEHGEIRGATADLALDEVDARLDHTLPALRLDTLNGRLQAAFSSDGTTVAGRGVSVLARAGEGSSDDGGAPIRIDPTDFDLMWRQGREGGTRSGSLEVNQIDLGSLGRLASFLPLAAEWRQMLEDYAPQGELSGLTARWSGSAQAPVYSLKTAMRDVGVRAHGAIPGLSGITGTLDANEKAGRVVLHSGKSSIDLPAVFEESLTRLDSLDVQADWKVGPDGLAVNLGHMAFSNADVAGSAQGNYRTAASGPGIIDLTANLTRADARAVWRYLPNVVGQGARHWLRDSLLAGRATEAHLTLKGNLNDFPFLDKRLGQFLVTVKARDAVLDYGVGWPRIDGIAGDLRFEGNGMTIDAHQGRILGARLSGTDVRIPDFDAPISTLYIKGKADGPTAEFLKFVERSPVAGKIDHFTDGMLASGKGHLDIDLTIPLDERKLDESKISGDYRFINNEVTVDSALPPLRQVNGNLHFSGNNLSVPEINALLSGMPLKIRGGLQKDGRVLITADGQISVDQMRQQSGSPLLASLSGSTPFHGEVRINGRNTDLSVESNLVGIASSLPEPFGKAAAEPLPLRLERRLLPGEGKAAKSETPARDQLSASLGKLAEAQIVRRKTNDGFVPERGAIAVGRPLSLPEKGVVFGLTAKRLDVDAWRHLLGNGASGTDASSESAAEPSSAWAPDGLSAQVDEVQLGGLVLDKLDLSATRAQDQWNIRVNARQAAGNLVWHEAGKGKLVARLSRLSIERGMEQHATLADGPTRRLPALDIVADDFSVRNMRFGRLNVQASNDGNGWNLNRIAASNPYGSLTGKGSWTQINGASHTQLSFKVDSSNVGELLARFGYPGTVKDGTAELDGTLAWNGAPTELDYASMNGEMNLKAAKGQFLKHDPGAAGKLLGLISLQNLPRRIALDFKDVFSDGLVFDAIDGKVDVQHGVMHTDRLQIDSPVARVLMRGDVDLGKETQRLDVAVQPEVGDTAALGVAMLNPAVGAATWIASKVLSNPLGSVFGFHYLITGTWDDLKVEKVSAPPESGKSPPP